MVFTQQPEAVVLQSGQSGSGGGLHVFCRHCFSALSDDTDQWFECDFLPTVTVQGRVTKSSSTENDCAATNVPERKSIEDSPFDLVFDEEDEAREGY